MARVKRGVTKHARHKKILTAAKGARGRQKNTFRAAIQRVEKNRQYAYRDRRNKKRDFRKLWIVRINAACRLNDITYSRFIDGCNKAGINLNRKVLSEIAIHDPNGFSKLVEQVKAQLA